MLERQGEDEIAPRLHDAVMKSALYVLSLDHDEYEGRGLPVIPEVRDAADCMRRVPIRPDDLPPPPTAATTSAAPAEGDIGGIVKLETPNFWRMSKSPLFSWGRDNGREIIVAPRLVQYLRPYAVYRLRDRLLLLSLVNKAIGFLMRENIPIESSSAWFAGSVMAAFVPGETEARAMAWFGSAENAHAVTQANRFVTGGRFRYGRIGSIGRWLAQGGGPGALQADLFGRLASNSHGLRQA